MLKYLEENYLTLLLLYLTLYIILYYLIYYLNYFDLLLKPTGFAIYIHNVSIVVPDGLFQVSLFVLRNLIKISNQTFF